MRRLAALLRATFRRRAADRELDEELRFHLEMQALEHRRRGMSDADARQAAADTFGGYERVKEQCRDARGGRALEMLGQDIRFAWRTLRAAPGFTALAVVTLGLGIGANTAIFSAVHAVLLRPLPYHQDDRLVRLLQRDHATAGEVGFSPPEIDDYRARAGTLSGLVEYHRMAFSLLGGAAPRRVQAAVVSTAFFDVLGLAPLLGRAFEPGDAAPEATPALVLGYRFWQHAFDGDPGVIGRAVEMNDRLHTIVGVLPPAPLASPPEDDVYMPVSSCPFRMGERWRTDRAARGISLFGRLRDGATLDGTRAELHAIAARLRATSPEAEGVQVDAIGLRDELTRDARPTFVLLIATAAFVLLIACANVACLTLASLARRERELALRTALGAGRRRLARQLLTESTILALAGGALGLAMAAAGRSLVAGLAARFTPRADEIAIDGTVLAFTLGLSMLTGVLFGTLPACCRPNATASLRDGSDRATSSRAARRARAALVAAQLAASVILLVGAGLTLRSLMRLERIDPGFNPINVVTARIDLNWSTYHDKGSILDFTQRLLARIRALPGVSHAAVANTFPLELSTPYTDSFEIRGRASASPPPQAEVRSASAGYFPAVGIHLVRGRLYRDEEAARGAAVVVINESLARRYWGASDPLGQQVTSNGGRTWLTIVGVVSDVRHYGLDRGPVQEAYVPWSHHPWRDVRLVVRGGASAADLEPALREAVRRIDPAQPVSEIEALQDRRQAALAPPRLIAALLGAFAALALAMAVAGLAGVVAGSVNGRTREFGIRLALGAEPAAVVRLVLRESLGIVAAGLALGIIGAAVVAHRLSSLLFEIEPGDPVTFLLVTLVLVGVAACACLAAARRGTRVDPVTALRAG